MIAGMEIGAFLLRRLLPGLLIAAAIAWGVNAIEARGYSAAERDYKPKVAAAEAKVEATKLEYQGKLDAQKIAHDTALREAEHSAKLKIEAQSENAYHLSQSLVAAKSSIAALNQQLQERASHVSTFFRDGQQGILKSIPAWIVTNGWLCDYNRAIGYGSFSMSASGESAGRPENPACAADAFGSSGVTAEEILVHHERYGAYCRQLEEQIDRLDNHLNFIEAQPSK